MEIDFGYWILGLDMGTGFGDRIRGLDLGNGFGEWILGTEVQNQEALFSPHISTYLYTSFFRDQISGTSFWKLILGTGFRDWIRGPDSGTGFGDGIRGLDFGSGFWGVDFGDWMLGTGLWGVDFQTQEAKSNQFFLNFDGVMI